MPDSLKPLACVAFLRSRVGCSLRQVNGRVRNVCTAYLCE